MNTAVIVEPRQHRALSFVLNNVLDNLSLDWNVIIFHGTDNDKFIEDIIKNDISTENKGRILLENLNVSNITVDEYSSLLSTVEFYKKIPTENILIFQTDSMILGKNKCFINDYLQYDYVGAPWPINQHWGKRFNHIGNGGFSLRKKSKMIEVILKNGKNKENEDGYFSDNKNNLLKPDYEKAKQFAMESVFCENVFACHSPWRYFDINRIFKSYPAVRELYRLQGPSKQFVTFGGGEQQYIDAGNRIVTQACLSNIFDKCTLYTDTDLKKDQDFWNAHSKFIESNSRGIGYWLWKPYIIKKTIENMKDDELLIYADSGCEIDYKKSDIFFDIFNKMKNLYIGGTKTCYEKQWSKMDLITHLEMKGNDLLNTRQNQATVNIYRVCDKVRIFVNKWYDLACLNNYHFLDDSPSIEDNYSVFIEHRHDQSIFSILSKKMDMFSVLPIDSVILIKRNRSGKPILM